MCRSKRLLNSQIATAPMNTTHMNTAQVYTEIKGDPPQYDFVATQISPSQQPNSLPCHHNGTSQTPHLDAYLRQPGTKARILSLTANLENVVNGNCCSTCAANSAKRTLGEYLRDLYVARKEGQWSRQEAKAVRAEANILMKSMKREMKALRRMTRCCSC